MVYPLAGNEAAIGFDLLNHPIQGAMTRPMLETELAGPVELVQGGTALIHRVPILLTPPGGLHPVAGIGLCAAFAVLLLW